MTALNIPADAPPMLSDMAALAVRIGSGAVVFSPDDKMMFATQHFRTTYGFCDFTRSLTFDDLLLSSLLKEGEAGIVSAESPVEKLERTKRRRRVERMEFVRNFPVPLMCLHWMHQSGWSIQIRAEPKHVGLTSFFDEEIPAFGLLEALRRREEMAQRAAVLDSIDLAIGVLGPEGKLRYHNAALQALIEKEDSFLLDAVGRLTAIDERANIRLRREIAAAAFARPGSRQATLCLRRSKSSEPHILSISKGVGALSGLAVLVVAPTMLDAESLTDILIHDFGLTGAQAEVAGHVGTGLSPEAAAVTLGKSYETARTQLKGAFARLGKNIETASQPRLARFAALLSSVSGAARSRGK